MNGRIVNSSIASVNSSTVSNTSNEKTVVIIDEADVNAPPDDSISVKSLNLITGLYAGEHSIVPAAFMSGNFDISYRLGKLTILPKNLILKADDKNDTCGTKPEFTLNINGLQYDDSLSSLFVNPPTYKVFNDLDEEVTDNVLPQGTYSIQPNAQLLAESSYSIQQFEDGILTSNGPLAISLNGDIACSGGTACVEVSVTGGVPPYSGAETFCGYPAGSYPFAILDNRGCTVLDFINLIDPPPLIVNATQDPIDCYGGSTCIHVSASGGVAPYDGTGTICGYNAGLNYVEVTDANNCIVSLPVDVSEPSKLNATTTVTNAICLSNGTATANVIGGTAGYSYQWMPDGQTTQTISGLSTGTYTVKITDTKGCTTTATAVVGFSGSLVSISGTISGPAGVCKGQSGVVYCFTPVAGATSYIWSLPKGASIVGSATGNCITVNFSSKYKGGFLCVQATNLCSTTPSSCKNIIQLNKEPKTPGSVVGPKTICPLSTGIYMIALVKDASSYTWSGTDGLTIISGQGTNTVTVKAPAGFTAGNIKVSASNCIGVSGLRSKKITGITEMPVWKPNNLTVGACGGQTIDYEIEEVPGASSYIWYGPLSATLSDGLGNFGNPLTITGKNNNGKYAVHVTFPSGFIAGNISVAANNICGAGPLATMLVKSVPDQPGSLTVGNLSVCKGQSNLNYKILNVPGASSYSWSITGGAVITNNGNNNSIVVNFNSTTSSPVILTVIANNACGSSVAKSFQIDVNFACRTIGDNVELPTSDFEVYPNPFNNKVNVTLIGKTIKSSDVNVFDLLGNIVPVNITNISSNNGVELDLSGYGNGMYIIRINVEDEYKFFQVIKE